MTRFRTVSGYLLLFTALVINFELFIYGGAAEPFYTTPFIVLAILLLAGLVKAGITGLLRKRYLPALLHLSWALLLVFYLLNQRGFEHIRIPVEQFDTVVGNYYPDAEISLKSHSVRQKGNLTAYERAVISDSSGTKEITLNHPAVLTDDVTLYVTGTGQYFLLTRSPYLTVLVVVSLLSTVMLGIWTFRRVFDDV